MQSVDSLPIVAAIADPDRLMQIYLKNIMATNDMNSKASLRRIIEDSTTPLNKIKVGLAFMKAVFLRYSMPDQVNMRHLETFFRDDASPIFDALYG